MKVRIVSWVFVLLVALAISPGSASADSPGLPVFDGLMTFGPIQDPSAPEDFSWEVILGKEQSLKSIDSQYAEVVYEDGPRAYLIQAEAAHDADGSTVPTSLSVSEGDVITLTVHHQAGNPAAGGAPFVYPINPGPGWEGGFVTEIVVGPKDEQELREERERIAREEREALEAQWGKGEAAKSCLVPRLKGRSLKASKRRLREADCRVGKVRTLKGATARTGKVVKQSPLPGQELASGTPVSVALGE